MASIVLADDHALVRVGLRRILEAHGHVVLDEVGDGLRVVQVVEASRPDVLLLDLGLPGLHGLDVLRAVTRRSPATKVLVVSAYSREEFVVTALRQGAAGYVLKGSQPEELLAGVAEVAGGGYYVSPQLAGSFAKSRAMDAADAKADVFDSLTPRELQVFHLMAEGLANWEIGPRLSVGDRTVETHRQHIMRKLALKTQTDVVLYALRRGILAFDDVGGAPRRDV